MPINHLKNRPPVPRQRVRAENPRRVFLSCTDRRVQKKEGNKGDENEGEQSDRPTCLMLPSKIFM